MDGVKRDDEESGRGERPRRADETAAAFTDSAWLNWIISWRKQIPSAGAFPAAQPRGFAPYVACDPVIGFGFAVRTVFALDNAVSPLN